MILMDGWVAKSRQVEPVGRWMDGWIKIDRLMKGGMDGWIDRWMGGKWHGGRHCLDG